jgi:hypothetical protein
MALRASWQDDRIAPRDETWRRVRVTDGAGARLPALVVNLSPQGLMARVEEPIAAGDTLTFDLPHVGSWRAEVRWSLGGRVGCKFERAIASDDYPRVLMMMR